MFCAGFCAASSVTCMAVVSCERYIALFFPLRYPTLVTHSRAYVVCLCTWMFWIGNMSLSIYTFTVAQGIGIVIWLLSCSAIGTTYLKILLLVRHHRRQIQSQQAAAAISAETASQTKRAVIMGYVIGVSILCYLPYLIVSQLFFRSEKPNATLLGCFILTMVIQFTSSSINPIIYCWKRQDFRQSFLALLANCCR